jgi:hypothetical protein
LFKAADVFYNFVFLHPGIIQKFSWSGHRIDSFYPLDVRHSLSDGIFHSGF